MHHNRRIAIQPYTPSYIYKTRNYNTPKTMFETQVFKSRNVKHSELKKKGASQVEMSAVKQFLGFTSLPGFAQYGRQKNHFGRLFWLFCFFGGLSLGIYQSWGLIDDYFLYKTYQQTVTHVNRTLALPAITLCSKSPVRWKVMTGDDWLWLAIKMEEECAYIVTKYFTSQNETLTKVKERFIKEVVLLNALNNMWKMGADSELRTKTREFVMDCLWNYVEPCNISKSFIEFYEAYYGTCYTFNSGLQPEVEEIQVEPGKSLTLVLYLDLDQEFEYLPRNTGIIALFHEPGTAAVTNQANAIHAQPGDWMKIELKVQTYKRLPAPYSSQCVDFNDKTLQMSSVYYDEEKPYRYSFEACMASCVQISANKSCTCVSAKIPWYKDDWKQLCPYKEDCFQQASKYDPKTCWCPFTCKENVYTSKITSEPDLLKFKYWREAAIEILEPVRSYFPNNTILNKKFLSSRIVVLDVFFGSALYDETVEFAKYTIADFWGAVGGNIGFWTGISVLSSVELLELLYLVFNRMR